MRQTNLLLSILTIILFSCQKEIEYKGDLGENFLVVNGIIENDSVVRISLSKSTPAIGEQATGSSEIISLATLTLTDNSTSETFTSNSVNSQGYYEFGTTAKTGHSYSISIAHPSFTLATSTSSVPQNLSILSWDSTSYNETNSYSSELTKIKSVNIHWQDLDGANKYAVKVFSIDTLTGIETSLFPRIPDFLFGNSFEEGKISLFNDETFNTTTMSLNISFEKDFYYDMTYTPVGEKSYRIVLYNLSNDVYNYIVSTSKAVQSGNSPFAQPVKVYTNITNGLGIFGGTNSTNVKIK